MKKKLFFILCLCFCLSGFAAGYRGTYWGEPITELVGTSKLKLIREKYSFFDFCTEPARMLGQPTEVYYALLNQKLYAICYAVDDTAESREMVEELLRSKKLKLKVRKQKLYEEKTLQDAKKSFDESVGDLSPAVLFIDDIYAHNTGGKSLLGGFLNAADVETYNTEMIEAEFNYDTEVYIFRGIYPEKILVCYVEKPQDF